MKSRAYDQASESAAAQATVVLHFSTGSRASDFAIMFRGVVSIPLSRRRRFRTEKDSGAWVRGAHHSTCSGFDGRRPELEGVYGRTGRAENSTTDPVHRPPPAPSAVCRGTEVPTIRIGTPTIFETLFHPSYSRRESRQSPSGAKSTGSSMLSEHEKGLMTPLLLHRTRRAITCAWTGCSANVRRTRCDRPGTHGSASRNHRNPRH